MSDSFGTDNSFSTHFEKETYYYVGDYRVRLFPNPQVFVVRLDEAARLRPEVLSEQTRHLLANARPVTYLPRDGLSVYRADSALKLIEALRQEAGVAQAFQAYQRTHEGGDTVIVTPRLLIQFRLELSADRIAAALEKLNLRILEPLSYASPNGFLAEAAADVDGLGALKAANTLVEEKLVVFAEPDLIQSRHWRAAVLPDPTAAVFLDEQWHLRATGVPDAWKVTRGDPAIRIAILDDGLDVGHAEFSLEVAAGQPKITAQFDFATGTEDASPKTYIDSHGTACAGVAASAGVKAAGVAPGCRLVVGRTPDFLGVSDEAKMFQWAADSGADVISCSWGPVDGTGAAFPLPTPTKLAIHYCLTTGRAGKGIAIFWAAGNGFESVSADGYASNPEVMAIAACTAAAAPAPYSDYGPEIFACAPSNGGYGQPRIFTTDRRGAAGYNLGNILSGDAQGDYTNSFGGTSAATPQAAGIAALMLSVNPDLTAARLRDLLRTTAERIGDGAGYDADGHSDRLGYGRLNAAAAVQAALQLLTTPASTPTILGPESWSRVDSPPKFQVDPTPHAYYVVEVTNNPELFDYIYKGTMRTVDNFYGSWSDGPFQTGPTYTLPPAAWVRLRTAERLWYRVGSSGSVTGYVDYVVSTPDDQGLLAKSIHILSGTGAPPPLLELGRRTISDLANLATARSNQVWIEGPLRWDRYHGPPTFRVEVGSSEAYAVKLAADEKYLVTADSTRELPKGLYFTSDWIKRGKTTDTSLTGFLAYIVPLDAWEALRSAQRLYCQLVAQDSDLSDLYVSSTFEIDLTGEAAVLTKDREVLKRIDEALWRSE